MKSSWHAYVLSFILGAFSIIVRIPFADSIINFKSDIQQYFPYPIISTIAINTVILIIINSIVNDREKQRSDKIISNLNFQKLEAEKLVLIRQLQPHFLFNALSTLKSLISEDPELAEDYSIKLSDFLRYSVESQNSETVSIASEMKFVNDYVALQKIRFDEAFTFTIDLPDSILISQVPIFSIQTLVENAFKHNYFTEKNPLKILLTHNSGVLKIENNLVSTRITERAGTGLENLKKRYRLITGKEIEINKTQDTFCVLIPIISK
ncbi:MAG: two-component system LytT family sensor kinase [Flavobacteriales bacterium]|jgi:two-component system LytT family sensor kinase